MKINSDMCLELAKEMHVTWLKNMRDRGYHLGTEHKSEGVSCPLCHLDVAPWDDLNLVKRLEYVDMAHAVLKQVTTKKFWEVIEAC